MTRPTILTAEDDILWALAIHVKASAPTSHDPFGFAVLYGNEDAPTRIDFWHAKNPDYDEAPDYIWLDNPPRDRINPCAGDGRVPGGDFINPES